MWTEGDVPSPIKSWITGFDTAADSNRDDAPEHFTECFKEDATMLAMGGLLPGKQGSV